MPSEPITFNRYNMNAVQLRFYSKSELAKLANVSYSTFYRYLKTHRQQLDAMGIPVYAQKLPPQVVKLICEDYCIDLK